MAKLKAGHLNREDAKSAKFMNIRQKEIFVSLRVLRAFAVISIAFGYQRFLILSNPLKSRKKLLLQRQCIASISYSHWKINAPIARKAALMSRSTAR